MNLPPDYIGFSKVKIELQVGSINLTLDKAYYDLLDRLKRPYQVTDTVNQKSAK